MKELVVAGIDPIAIAEADINKGEVVFYPKKTVPEKIKEEVGDKWYNVIEVGICVIFICFVIWVMGKFGW